MHVSDLDHLLWIASDAGQLALLLVLVIRRLHRSFPLFAAYVSWQLISDLLLFLAISGSVGFLRRNYTATYYSLNVVTYLLELSVLVEIGSNVLRPARKVLSQKVLYLLLSSILAVGVIYFLLVEWLKAAQFANLRIFLIADETSAILCLVIFLLVAAFSQILGLTWKNHVLQLATGLAFFSLIDLVSQLMLNRLAAGPAYASQYRFWGRFQTVSYFCTVFFWCYAFLKQEAPRKEFSPQMQKILVQLSGSAKRQTAVLARSREP
jgi:hypothetical protein